MRELKFRAWWKDTKRFLDGDEWYMTCSGAKFLHYAVTPYNDDDFVIEQYTGLKDSNGKEIYEGDIIHRGALSKANIFRNSVIRFDEGSVGFIATSTRNGARTLFNGHTCDEINVIGNIHENPELLGGIE